MTSFRLITFDATNTLIRVLGSPGQQYSAIAAIYGVHVRPSHLTTAFKYRYQQYTRKYPNFGMAAGMTPYNWWTDLVKDCFRSAADTDVHKIVLPSANENEVLTQIANHLYIHFSSAKAWEVLPGTEFVLSKLKERGYRVGVISNFDGRLDTVLSCLALRHYFDFVTSSTVVGFEKPDKRIFEHALSLAKVSPAEAVHVGDSFENDFIGARNIGMSAFLVNDGNKPLKNVDVKYVVHSLPNLLEMLK